MNCKLCQQVRPNHPDKRCAFRLGHFSSDNWGCETMLELRDYGPFQHTFISDDEMAVLLPVEIHRDSVVFHFLLVGWYKRRGRTSECRFMDGEGRMYYPTESEILEVIGID